MAWDARIRPGGSDDNLEIEGIIYPPSQPDSATRTIGHLCSEYTTEELEECIPYLKDLQLCLEHDKGTVIGKVVDASLTASNGMWIKAVVSASSEVGRETIKRIKTQQLPGLSLSHDFHLFAKPGSQLQQLIHSARDWQQMQHDGTQASCHKTLRELSVCKEPAREGCYIHKALLTGVVSASKPGASAALRSLQALLRLMPDMSSSLANSTDPSTGLSSQVKLNQPVSIQNNQSCAQSAGGASYIFPRVHALADTGLGALNNDWTRIASGTCSFSLNDSSNSPMESAPQSQAGQALPAAGQPAAQQTASASAVQQGVAQIAPQAAAPGNPVMAAMQQQQQQAELAAQQMAQQASAMAVDQAAPEQPVLTEPQVAPDQQTQEQAPAQQLQEQPPAQPTEPSQVDQAASEAQQQEAIANAMQQAQETILAQKQAQEAQAKAYTEQMAAIQKQLEEQQKQMAEMQRVKDENAAQLAKVKQEQQAQAEANKARMLAQLNATMQTIGSSLPNQQFVLPTPPQGEAAKDAAKQSEYEAKLMDTTINTMQALQTQNQAANMEARTNKRTASDALAAGYNFHTGNNMGAMTTPAAQMGTVNCSRDEAQFQEDRAKRVQMDPSKDKETVLAEQIREWYAAQKAGNAKVDFTDCSRQFDSMRAHLGSSAVMGTVSCSKGGMWSSSNLVEGNVSSASLCMQQMQPELFDAISDLNPGRIISPAETKAMMDTIQVASAGPRR